MNELINFSLTADSIPISIVVFNIILAFGLSLLIALVYRNTHKGLSYSQTFTFTLVLIGTMIAVIMMVIGGSLARAFGAFGAFSLIRFRTAIKDAKDVSFILIVVAIGLAVGTGNYGIAIVTTALIAAVVLILTHINFGSIRKYDYVLTFLAHSDRFSNDKLRQVFKEFLSYDNLLNVASRENGRVLDYSFNIKFLSKSDIDAFAKKMSEVEGVENVDVVTAKNDIEY